jgi:ABC-type multidrug transport system fused ATPase/permease subunit
MQKRTHLRKAFKLLLRARETWPWVVANNLVAVVSGVLSTVALDYHAELLETFRHPRFTQRKFFRVASAWAVVELCSHLMGVVGSQLSARGEKVASRILQVQLFRAITKQELSWWEKKTEADVGSLEGLVRHRMPYEVNKVLNIPRDYIHRISSVVAAAWRVRQRSGRLLYLMVGIHWVSILSRKAVRTIRALAQERAYRGVVMPSQDDRTFPYALRPEYATLYQSFVRSPKETRLFEQYVLDHQRFEQRMMTVGQILDPADKLVRQGSIISQIAAVGGLVRNNVASDGQARALMHHATEITREIETTYYDWCGSQEKCSELAKAFDMITLCPSINPDVGIAPSTRAKGSIVFEDVYFEYPSRKAGQVLKGVSFQVSPGQVAGIVGKTGCGKTTLFRLVERFYDVSGGRILLDGRDIRDYSPEWLRAQISTVSQEPDLIPLTIRDNITIGCPHDPSVEEIEEACRAANIWDVLNDKDKFPEGLQTKMRKVKNISGGEKQRVCIARAILANPPILLLDEATSALDKETEMLVQEALEKLMCGRTTLVIAHRLSTICDSHTILGMKDGKMVEQGTHEELLQTPDDAEDCVYGRLWREQSGERRQSESAPQQGNGNSSPKGQLGAIKSLLAEATRTRDLEKAKRGLLEVINTLQLQADELAASQLAAASPPSPTAAKCAEEAPPEEQEKQLSRSMVDASVAAQATPKAPEHREESPGVELNSPVFKEVKRNRLAVGAQQGSKRKDGQSVETIVAPSES